jgi:hypothetical protein
MFRIIRRAPWIAIGAAGAYFFDPERGSERRRDALDRAKGWTGRVREQVQGQGTLPLQSDAPLAPSVPDERVASRAKAPLAEEQQAGVNPSASAGMAEQILKESEWRVTDRAGTSVEHRRSEETV